MSSVGNNRATPPPALFVTHGVPADRFAYYERADASIIQEIRFGILFVTAWWSGPAYTAYLQLSRTLAVPDPEGRLAFIVVDIDGLPEDERAEFFGQRQGAGETAWVRDGRIVATSLLHGPACFEAFTRNFLAGKDDLLADAMRPRIAP